jgi:anti-sigma regulatory factor (Ser/Thr protein kinase)
VFEVAESSRVGEARRAAMALARELGLGETEAAEVGIVVTEAATNLVKHARGGVLLIRALEHGRHRGVEVLAVDDGKGIADIEGCLRDGCSTVGTPGTGLGAIRRLASEFDIYSQPGSGTALVARLWPRSCRPDARRGDLDVGAAQAPMPGENVSGDACAVHHAPGRWMGMIADGLGHGPSAADAAQQAVRVFREHALAGSAELMQRMHLALRGTRGAAVAVAEINVNACGLRFTGVGNIAGRIVHDGTSRGAISYNGIVGHEMRKVQEFSYPFPSGALLVMHSDGLASHWRLDQYEGLAQRHPALIAGVLYRDHKRPRDDVTVLTLRERMEGLA